MDRAEMERIFKQTGLMLEGHFLLTSGRHSNRYMQCAKLFQYPEYSEMICKDLADRFAGQKIDMVVGPAVGGIIMSYEMARQFKVPNIFAERENGAMTLRRGFSIPEGAKVLVVEDVVTTGISSLETKRVIEENGGICLGITCVVDRTKPEAPSPIPIVASALKLDLPNYAPEECPICKEGKLPLVHLGSRKMKQEAKQTL